MTKSEGSVQRLSIVVLVTLLLLGCGKSPEQIAEATKVSMQSDFDTNPEHKDWHLTVNSVTVVKQADNQYQGMAKVTHHGIVHDVPVVVTADSKNLLWKVEGGGFGFIGEEKLRAAIVSASVSQLLTEADTIKAPVAEYYATTGGRPSCVNLTGSICTSWASVDHGNIVISLDGLEAPEVTGKKVVMAFTTNAQYDVIWKCTSDAADEFIPASCRHPLQTGGAAVAAEPAKPSAESKASAPTTTAQSASSASPSSPEQLAAAIPSFDCGKASSAVEKLICATPELATADAELASFYKKNMAASGDNSAAVKQGQRAFLSARNQCATVDCVAEAYRARYEELGQLGYIRE